MIRLLIFTCIILSTVFRADCQSRFSFEVNTGIGYDLQTRSNNYNLTGPLVISSPIKSSILHIEKPYQSSLGVQCRINDNFSLLMDVGQSTRALRYWSIDTTITNTSFRNDKIDLKIKNYFVDLGVRFTTSFESPLNLFWDQTFGVGFGKSSPRVGLTKEHSQAELIYLHDRQYAALVNVDMGIPIVSLTSSIGINYHIFNKLSLNLGLKFVNELSNGNDLFIMDYNLDEDRPTGAYTPYDLEFKTILTEIGLVYRI